MQNDNFIPYGKIHELQITDKDLYAFEPVLCDAIYTYKENISDLRKKLTIRSEYPDTVAMLSEIQQLEGKIAILTHILGQLDLE